ncbi:hypothetical protein Vi05172_g5995 [Venturia inaequalis]|nr:hypothetical protein Vi05172_g5995 [Venturia inaequalis]
MPDIEPTGNTDSTCNHHGRPFRRLSGRLHIWINFIRELSKALKDSAESRHDYCELLCELESLEKAFVLVKDIKVDEALQAQKDEVARAALQCQGTILRFLIQIDKFKPSLSPVGSSNRWYDVLRKCQWVLKKEDVQKLRAQIQSHIASIGLGMVTLQINSTSLQPQAQNQGSSQCCTNGTQITNLGLSVSENTALLSDMLTDFGKSVSNNADLLSSLKDLVPTLRQMIAVQQPPEEFKIMSAKIHDTYQVISEMRQNLSVQIDRPSFYFLDACGVTATFDLAFFDNWDIFEIAIAAKFKERGLQIVAKKKYVLEDAHRKTSIDRTRGFKALFLPGRQINMDACFDDREALGTCCPVCRHIEGLASDEGIDWTHYKRIEEIVAPNSTDRPMPSSRRKRKASELEDDNSSINEELEDDISMYSRIRLRSVKSIELNVKKAKMERNIPLIPRCYIRHFQDHGLGRGGFSKVLRSTSQVYTPLSGSF